MNSREDILAEINMLKVLVWKLWEDRFDDIDNKEWDKMKKVNQYLSMEERTLVWELAKQITKGRWREEDEKFLSIE